MKFFGFFFCLFFYLYPGQVIGQESMVSENSAALLDLRSLHLAETPSVPLKGIWEVYWDTLLTPNFDSDQLRRPVLERFPHLWSELGLESTGAATYRLVVWLPKDSPELSLSIPDFYSSYRLYVNGKLFSENGTPALTESKYTPKWLPLTQSLAPYLSSNSTGPPSIELLLQIANYDHSKGGANQNIVLGTSRYLQILERSEQAFSFTLTGSLLMAALFFLGLYTFGRKDKSILYFALFCLLYTYRIIGFGSYPLHSLIPEAPWSLTLHLEYLTLFLSVFFFGEYTYQLYPKEASRKVINPLSFICLVFAGVTLIFSPSVFTQLITPFFLIIILYIFYAFYVYTIGYLHHRPGSAFALASTGVALIVFLYQIAVYFGYAERSLIFNFTGYILFVFLQSLILTYRFINTINQAKEEAINASKAKTEFLSTMSHEIRTPLNAVIGLSGLLSGSALNEEQKDFVKTIQLSGENLLSVINNILDYSKIESGELEINRHEVNLQSVVENVFELLSPLRKDKNVDLIFSMDDDVPLHVSTDQSRLQQILINLVGNAIKFTDEGYVMVKITTDQNEQSSANIRFEVKDTGIGIPEDKFPRLFKSFSQVDASSTREYGGSGLGLIISKKIIEALGGTIQVQSKLGSGSVFSFTIEAPRALPEKGLVELPDLSPFNIFILDDNEINVEILKKQCQKGGLSVTAFHDPRQLEANLDQLSNYDLGILDMQMPGMTGIDLAKEIRKKYSGEELKLVLLSSINESLSDKNRILFNLTLAKPVKQSQLLNHLSSLLNSTSKSKSDPDTLMTESSTYESGAEQLLRILVAEDNFINQIVTRKILSKLGYESDLANDGEEAVNKAAKIKYDLILMDMEMPKKDGIQSTSDIRSDESSASREAVIIALTANASTEDRDRCIEAGMNDFISKPITMEQTREKLEEWFDTKGDG